jgi:DNA invertase Pin-like site-specific DNA recombinase
MTAFRRCAVYTRKSSEEGLEQAFNSLHAQREACEAYIKSQAHEGWRLVKTSYDDGGFSGGSMERPALKRLLTEVAAGRINVVVVYKVDRLTRSLADFARIVETLDGHGASFVSVTQQFNTTTSMGRLTLNVLLSFAQFEREVTGERIRDKIAASKRKGMWMGGSVPLGYDVANRELVVNETEAATVRDIFDRYIRLGSVAELRADLQRRGILSKRWTSSTDRIWGGAKFSRGALYWLLRNPVYVGRVAHKEHIYEGRQAAIVEQSQWERAQALLSEKSSSRQRRPIAQGGRPLAGRLFDERGNAMSPSYSIKRNGHRYHYYVSQALLQNAKGRAGRIARVPAEEIERLVREAVKTSDNNELGSATELLRQRVARVVVHADRIEIVKAVTDGIPGDEEGESRTIIVRAKLAHRNRAVVLDDGRTAPDPVLLKALCRAHEWRTWLEQGEAPSYQELASKAGVTPGYVQKVLPLAFLAPGLTRELLDGRRRLHGGLMARLNRRIPIDWDQQLNLF